MFKITTVKQDDGSISDYNSDIIKKQLDDIIKTSGFDFNKYKNEPLRRNSTSYDLLKYTEYNLEKNYPTATEVTAEQIKDVLETTLVLNAYPEIVKNYFKTKTDKIVSILVDVTKNIIDDVTDEEVQTPMPEEIVEVVDSPEDENIDKEE